MAGLAGVAGDNRAADARNDAISDCAGKFTEGVADGDDGLSDDDGFGVAKFGGREIVDIIDLEISDVIDGIETGNGDIVVNGAVAGDDADFGGTTNDVAIGDDMAVAGQNYASAGTGGSVFAKQAIATSLSEDGDDAIANGICDCGDRLFGEGDGVISVFAV